MRPHPPTTDHTHLHVIGQGRYLVLDGVEHEVRHVLCREPNGPNQVRTPTRADEESVASEGLAGQNTTGD